MCLLKVKEDQEYSVPARVRRTKWTSTESTSPPRTSHYSNTRVVESPRVSSAPLPPPPPSSAHQSYYKESRTAYRQSETAISPSVHKSTVATESKYTSGTSRAPSQTRSHYVEVEHHDDSSSSGSSSASNEDVRSRTTHQTSKTSNTRDTRDTRQSSKSRTTAPTSQYSVHEREREVRRERTISRPRDEYQTYQYINAPLSASRSRDYSDPRASSRSYGQRSQQYHR